MAEILLAEDAPSIRAGVKSLLEGDYHSVRAVSNGADAVVLYRRFHPDLVILDVMMPRMDGLEALKTIRQCDDETPVMLLTARATEADLVLGFGLGCDDYVRKPFSSRELQMRVAALLRRTWTRLNEDEARHEDAEFPFCGGFVVPLDRAFITESRKMVRLSESEIRLMRLLARNPNRTIRKADLTRCIWCGYSNMCRSVDTHISNIRRKLGHWGRRICCIYGIGYKYVPESQS